MWVQVTLIICLIQLRIIHPQEDDEEVCNDGVPCIETAACSDALRQIQLNKNHNYTHCGWTGPQNDEEQICCPNSKSPDECPDDAPCTARDKCSNYSTTNRSCGDYNVCCPKEVVTAQSRFSGSGATTKRPVVRQCENKPPNLKEHILHGNPVNDDEATFMVALALRMENTDRYEFVCSGSLISNNFVLTAAHCVKNKMRKNITLVRTGILSNKTERNNRTDYNVKASYVYENKTAFATSYYDIALLELESEVTEVNLACIQPDALNVPKTLTIYGYGPPKNGLKGDVLLKGTVDQIPFNICNKSIDTNFHIPDGVQDDIQFCAKDAMDKYDTCKGDSGGPIGFYVNRDFFIVGVTSFGKDIGSDKCSVASFGIYVKIYNEVILSWIEKIVWGLS